MVTVVSFYVERPEEHPEAAARNYPGMLQVLQRSCDLLGLAHVVLTDNASMPDLTFAGLRPFVATTEKSLMRAATDAQARYLEMEQGSDILFVGADCIVRRDPTSFYPDEADICLTYRGPTSGMPINTGAQFIRRHAIHKAAKLYRRVARRCGTRWCDDQRSLCAELRPLPLEHGTFQRGGLKVGFVPLDPLFNVIPNSPDDECAEACVVHFKGKSRKQLFFDWARRHGYA